MNLVVVGTGYVGLVSGLGFAKLGHKVACVDIDPEKIAKLDLGEPTFYEPGLPELLREMQEEGRVVFTTRLRDVVQDADIIMLAVQTPQAMDGEANLSYIYQAAEQIGELLDHEALIAVKSTVPPGTNREVLKRVRAGMEKVGRGELASLVSVASTPEFLREGQAVSDFFNAERLAYGAEDEVTLRMLDQLHKGIDAPTIHLSIEDSELAKYAANAYLATKISFINEIANIAERVGADVTRVAEVIGSDSRIGPAFLRAGIGYGGSCFPKDVNALFSIANTKGYGFKLLSAVIEVNKRQRERFVARVLVTLDGVKDRRIAVWGLAFKGGTDDIRDSIAIDIVRQLQSRGAEIIAYDPKAMDHARAEFGERIQFAPTAVDAVDGADALLVLSEWPEFRDVSFSTVRERMLTPRIFDGRNLLHDLKLGDQGFAYYGVGFGENA